MSRKLSRTCTTLVASATLLVGSVGVANADPSIPPLSFQNPVKGACAFIVTLPSTDIDRTSIAVDATATSTVAVVSTSVQCFVRDGSGRELGRLGISLPGSVAAIAGEVNFERQTAGLQACVRTNAARLDGSNTNPNNVQTCVPLSSNSTSPTVVTT